MMNNVEYNVINSTVNSVNMNVVTANELKLKGVGALEQALKNESEAIISVRGKPRFVVMDEAQYEYLRDCELSAAIAESKADIAAGRYAVETADAHMKRLKRELADEL